jgi:single-strand selective monofunctional uracil DNA glycosylase
MDMLSAADTLLRDVKRLRFGPPVRYVYNPLQYARRPFELYVRRYGCGPKQVVLLGMNPGPWGMAQTGVPFGEVSAVRDWLGIEAPVGKPPVEHPKKPVEGFRCKRSEVSGARIWGWARGTFGTPRRFFEQFFIMNYCPLTFLEASGRNRTPDQLPADERKPLLAACDRALRLSIDYLQPQYVIGVGVFAENRARAALEGMGIIIGRILHPSPASPQANRDWAATAAEQLRALGVRLPEPRRGRAIGRK